MRIKFLVVFSLTICLLACKSEGEKDKAGEEPKTSSKIDAHNSKNALDWNGTYEGVLPCADCEGIETKIVLHDDLTYEMQYKYRGGNGEIFREKGRFEWNDAGSQINLMKAGKAMDAYKVGENKLIKLDPRGNQVQGDLKSRYVLRKKMAGR